MSYSFELKIGKGIEGVPHEQKSPLRFATEQEAFDFGKNIFEPPRSVRKWKVIPTTGKHNCWYDGKFMWR